MGSKRKKAMKQLAREQAKREKKFANKDPKTTNELLGIKSIGDYNKKNIMENFGFSLRSAWYFEKWFEKLILVVLCVLGMWKIVGFF